MTYKSQIHITNFPFAIIFVRFTAAVFLFKVVIVFEIFHINSSGLQAFKVLFTPEFYEHLEL